MMNGYKLTYGIWNFDHSITSRDVGTPEVYKTMDELNKILREKNINYKSLGYEFWFTDITDVDIRLCNECGKHCETHKPCWYCGAKNEPYGCDAMDIITELKELD